MVSFSVVSLLSVVMSILAIVLVFGIFKKVYIEKQRRPWVFIGISAVFLALSELLRFMWAQGYVIINSAVSEAIMFFLVFISISFLAFGLLLEYLIIQYIKGKFVKIKFIPVQEGSLSGELDIDVSKGNSYIATKKDRTFMIDQFAQAAKSGFEGFLINEKPPRDFRVKYNLEKTPVAWVIQTGDGMKSDYIKQSLDPNSDVVDPLQINNVIGFVDSFLEQSSSPFLLIEMNEIFRHNSFYVVVEFLKYVNARIQKYNGVAIIMINEDVVDSNKKSELTQFLKELE